MPIKKLLLCLLIAGPALSLHEDMGFYVVKAEFLEHLKKYQAGKPLQVLGGQALVMLTASERDELVGAVHEVQSFCAGATDVTEEYVNTQNKENFLENFLTEPSANLMADHFEIRHQVQAQALMKLADKTQYMDFLKRYTAFPDRYGNSKTGQKASLFLKNYLEQLAKAHGRTDIEIHEVPTSRNYIQNSVYARLPGTDSSLPAIVVGGHMDTLRDHKPGADDDASGTAVVAELYRAILESGMKFKRDIYLAFYAAEEVGLVGSNAMARLFKSRGIELRGVLQFDMVGYKSPEETLPMHFVEDNVSAELTEFTKQLAIKYLGLSADDLGTVKCHYACSDHASWNRQGYPTAFPFESSMQNMNHTIHTANDTIDLVNPDHAIQFVKLGSAWIAELAEAHSL